MKLFSLSLLMAVASMVSTGKVDLSWKNRHNEQLARLNYAIGTMNDRSAVRACNMHTGNMTDFYLSCKKGRQEGQVMILHLNWRHTIKTGVTIKDDKDVIILFSGRTAVNMTGGDVIAFKNCTNVLVRSSVNGFGGLHANAYMGNNAYSMIRFMDSSNVNVNNLALVDSSRWNILFENVKGAEVHNVHVQSRLNKIANDAVGVSGTNVHIHDVSASVGASCVVVRPSTNVLVERILCARSDGSGIGTLGDNAKVQQVTFRNIYNYLVKSPFIVRPTKAINASVHDLALENFVLQDNTNGFQMLNTGGVTLSASNLEVTNWQGQVRRSPSFVARCSGTSPCRNLVVSKYNITDPSGRVSTKLQSVETVDTNTFSTGELAAANSNQRIFSLSFLNSALFLEYANNASLPFPKSLPTQFFPGMSSRPAARILDPYPKVIKTPTPTPISSP